jgi:hypothetical protein
MKADLAMEASNGLCGGKTRSRKPCRKTAGWGTSHQGVGRCSLHGGATPTHEISGQVTLARREFMAMGRPLDVDPIEAILECIRITAGEVQYASERISELEHDELVGPVVTSRPLKEEKGAEDPSVYVEEFGQPALHIWVKVRHDAMDRLVNYSKAAVAAGIAERQVKIAEGQAQQLAELYRGFVVAMGMDPADPKVREAMRGSLTLIAGGRAA